MPCQRPQLGKFLEENWKVFDTTLLLPTDMSNTNIDVSHKKVAIVLPIFNTEQYLPDCLDSILNQTHKNFIVFAVDDGSTDASPSILKSYTLQDNRIHPILIKNSGVSSARNAALEAIKNEDFDYISFIDSDDKFYPDFLESHLTSLLKNNADISVGGFEKLYENNTTKHRSFLPQTYLTQEQFALLVFSLGNFGNTCCSGGMIWKQVYKANLLRDIRFDPDRNACEDELFCLQTLSKTTKIVCIPKILYSYRQRPGGTSLTSNSKFDLYALKGRDACSDFAKNISRTLELICFSAHLTKLIAIIKDNDTTINLSDFKSFAYLAHKNGFLNNKYYLLFLLFLKYPRLTKVYRRSRALFYHLHQHKEIFSTKHKHTAIPSKK